MKHSLNKKNQLSKGGFLRIRGQDDSWRQSIEALRFAGAQHVEIVLEDYTQGPGFSAELIRACADIPILFHAPYQDITLVTPWDDIAAPSIERLKWSIGLANRLGALAVTLHAGFAPERVSDDDAALVRRLSKRLSILRSHAACPVTLETAEVGRLGGLRQIGSIATMKCLAQSSSEFLVTLDVEDANEDLSVYKEQAKDLVKVIHLHGKTPFEGFEYEDFPNLDYVTLENF